MDKSTAMAILEIKELNEPSLKKQYRKMALQHHPDKNGNSQDSTEKFKLVQESYEYLKMEIDLTREIGTEESETGKEDIFSWSSNYSNLLQSFLESILKENGKCASIIKEIVLNGCKKIPIDKEQAMKVYHFLSTYKTILHISQETLDTVKGLVMEKFKDDLVYIINPSLRDLLNDNVYKLVVDDLQYFVPLWHNEVYFDHKNDGEIIVKCEPDLPQNITIDENNVLRVELTIPFKVSLFDSPTISFFLEEKEYTAPILFKRIQTIYLPNCGVATIDETNITSVEKRSGIYVKLEFI